MSKSWKDRANAFSPWGWLVMLACFFATIFFLWGWLNDAALRLLMTDAQRARVFHLALYCGVAVELPVLLWLYFRYVGTVGAQKWWRTFGTYILAVLFALLAVAVIADSAIRVVAHHNARDPETLQAVIVRIGIHKGKAHNSEYADVQTADGRKLSLESDRRTIYAFVTGYTVRANGKCKVYSLPVGTSITLYGRHSDLGFALDEVTSATPCR